MKHELWQKIPLMACVKSPLLRLCCCVDHIEPPTGHKGGLSTPSWTRLSEPALHNRLATAGNHYVCVVLRGICMLLAYFSGRLHTRRRSHAHGCIKVHAHMQGHGRLLALDTGESDAIELLQCCRVHASHRTRVSSTSSAHCIAYRQHIAQQLSAMMTCALNTTTDTALTQLLLQTNFKKV